MLPVKVPGALVGGGTGGKEGAEAWGIFLSTDSPRVKRFALSASELGGQRHVVSSNGTFGHVTIESSTCETSTSKCARCKS
eukprot:1180332-Prorocentrum_minimum.AAC.2